MILGRVVGTLWATRKDPRLVHQKLMLVRPYFAYVPTHDTELLVAVDRVDAGVGDDVVVCMGTPARWSCGGRNFPVDAAIQAVVDRCSLRRSAFGHQRSASALGVPRRLAFIGGAKPRTLEWR